MPKSGLTFGIIGCGNLGSAVLRSAMDAEDGPSHFIASTRSKASAERLVSAFGSSLQVTNDNKELVSKSDILVIGVKPFMLDGVFESLKGLIKSNTIVISLLAGKTVDQVRKASGCDDATFFRATTNTPALVGKGMTALSYSPNATEEQIAAVQAIFNQAGRCIVVDEKYQDVCIGLCGSGPAFVLTVMEALCDGAVRAGLPYDLARECAAQVLVGAGSLALSKQDSGDKAGSHPAVLKNAVTTPGGTTIRGLMTMEERGVRFAISKAVQDAAEASKELSK